MSVVREDAYEPNARWQSGGGDGPGMVLDPDGRPQAQYSYTITAIRSGWEVTMSETSTLRFRRGTSITSLSVVDRIEQSQVDLELGTTITPVSASTEPFHYPVTKAVKVEADQICSQKGMQLWVYEPDGTPITEFRPGDKDIHLQSGDYLLDVSSLAVKIYVIVEDSELHLTAYNGLAQVRFPRTTTIRVGARSYHTHPSQTLATTTEPQMLMRAISSLGNSMKTWGPERTFPTLRGHPPLIEVTDEPSLSDDFSPPDTGITVTLPPEHEWLFPVAPLAYWLGATIEPGQPAIHTAGATHQLGAEGGYTAGTERKAFEQHIRDVLQLTYKLDCACRDHYTEKTVVKQEIEDSDLPINQKDLGGMPIDERLDEYLKLGRPAALFEETIERPPWRLSVCMEPVPSYATMIPLLARDIATVRVQPTGGSNKRRHGHSTSTYSSSGEQIQHPRELKTFTTAINSSDLRTLPETSAMEQGWIGDGYAVGAAKITEESYQHRLGRDIECTDTIDVDVVVNDLRMNDEAVVSEKYGEEQWFNFDVNIHYGLSQEQLAAVFTRGSDFIHYIGHVDERGLACGDGHLRAEQLSSVAPDTFVLNACSTYTTGHELVDNGAVAGVATLEDVPNEAAIKTGQLIATLLSTGFSLNAAVSFIQQRMLPAGKYVAIGEPNAKLVGAEHGTPQASIITPAGQGQFNIEIAAYANGQVGIGAMLSTYIPGVDEHHIVPGHLGPWEVSADELDRYLDRLGSPVVVGSRLYWPEKVSAAEVAEKLGMER